MDVSKVKSIKGRTPLRASSAIRAAQRSRGKSPGSLNFAYCPKIGRDIVFPSDLELLHSLHLEADERIASYELDPDRITAHLGEDGYVGSKPDAITTARDGQLCMIEVKYKDALENDLRAQLQVQAQRQAATKVGMDWRVYTDQDAQAEERLLNDWLHIVVHLSFCRGMVTKALMQQVREVIQGRGRLKLEEIKGAQIDAWHLVFAAIFQLIQQGVLCSDLKVHPLSRTTQVWVLDR
ncbi:MAG: hypothetical protein ACK4F4_11080 [Hylemonella sp.]|uniref:hypothetical protein n=1 Tax=Hylemonella sp. TaxID=2066020 RepID=UPI00391CE716